MNKWTVENFEVRDGYKPSPTRSMSGFCVGARSLTRPMYTVLLIVTLLFPFAWTAQAQSTQTVSCGENISNSFSDSVRSHMYAIDIESGQTLIVQADSIPLNGLPMLDIEIYSGNGLYIEGNPYSPAQDYAVIETSTLLSSGTYEVQVTGNDIGGYQVLFACVNESGEVVSGNNLVQGLSCGDQVDNIMLRPDEIHRYYIFLEDGEVMTAFLESLYGTFGEMTFELGLYSPDNQELDRISDAFKDLERTIFEQTATTAGVYRLYVKGYDSTQEDYRLSIDCTDMLASSSNRRVLTATVLDVEYPPEIIVIPTSENPRISVPLEDGINNGAVDFYGTTTIIYQFDGEEGETVTVHFQRVDGNINMGMAIWVENLPLYISNLLQTQGASITVELPMTGQYNIEMFLDDEYFTSDFDDPTSFTIEVTRE